MFFLCKMQLRFQDYRFTFRLIGENVDRVENLLVLSKESFHENVSLSRHKN